VLAAAAFAASKLTVPSKVVSSKLNPLVVFDLRPFLGIDKHYEYRYFIIYRVAQDPKTALVPAFCHR
jgi:hypothetical protein